MAAALNVENSLPTDIPGLDNILHGGLPRDRLFLIDGDPGSGKTTLSMQFLLAGARRGESCLLVTLSETEEELRATAASHAWSLDGIHIMELVASEDELKSDSQYTMFLPSEVELTETTKKILAEAGKIKPVRLVIDSLSELRLLADNPLRYRRQILALKQYFARQQCTVLLIDDRTGDRRDSHLHSLAHGVIALERTVPDYGKLRRRLQIVKMRGREFREGFHDYEIRRGGLEVFPRLVAAEHRTRLPTGTIASGLPALDALLGNGLPTGTNTLIMGPAGCGKSSLATQFARSVAINGERASLFLFDESLATLLERAAGLGMDIEPYRARGLLEFHQIDPAQVSPGEFTQLVRRSVEVGKSRVVVIDTLNGYLNAIPSERYLILHLHELLMYLGQQGVATLLVLTQHGIIGDSQVPLDASYLADTAMLLRYFEYRGEVRQALSVIKKRTGSHERTIRELAFSSKGIVIGAPVRNVQGILTGEPVLIDGDDKEVSKA